MSAKCLLILAALLLTSNSSTAQPPPNPCSAPEQKQFDFWLGEWDLTTPGKQPGEVVHNTNTIKRILDDCIIQENFAGGGASPLRGMSVSVFDPKTSKWKQTWVDNQGSYLDFTGEFKGGQMVLSRTATRPDGAQIAQRMVWKNIKPDEFDWSWERSKDGGQTWEVLWPIHYQRKP
jgi:Protein of unknown function (DUF1579)